MGMEDELRKRILALGEIIASGQPSSHEHAAKVDATKIAMASARERNDANGNGVVQCKTELAEAKANHKAATSSVTQLGPEMKQVEKDLASAKNELAAGPFASYKELLDYTAILPPAPPAAEEEGAPNADVSAPTR